MLVCNTHIAACFKIARQRPWVMDSPVVNQIFRQLSAPSRRCLRLRSFMPLRKPPREQQCRTYALRRSQDDGQGGSKWQQRIDAFPKDMSKQLREYPKVTASDLRYRTQRPRRVKMLARDFIEGGCSMHFTARAADERQTVSTTPTTGTSPSMPRSSIQANHSNSPI